LHPRRVARATTRARPQPAPPPAEPRTSRAKNVYQSLKADIFDFRLLPGDRFTESEIAARMDVSRTPVREALQRLEKEGYLQVQFRAGWSVRELDFRQFDHLYDLRIILESAAVRGLCERPDLAGLDGLKVHWLVPATARVADGALVSGLDEAFHATLVAAAGNPEVARCHAEVTERIRILRRLDFTEPARVVATYREHMQILRLILRRRADQAAMLLRAHIEASKAEVRKISLHKLYAARARP
jgi:DNA-binding GntR family transcriptional regulator